MQPIYPSDNLAQIAKPIIYEISDFHTNVPKGMQHINAQHD